MNTLKQRIKAIEREIKAHNAGMFIVHYKNGSTRRIEPGEAINLTLEEAEKIDRFEEEPNRGKNGILEDLVNALLVPGEE